MRRASHCLPRLSLGQFVITIPSGLDLRLRLHCRLKLAAAGDAAELAIASGDSPRTLDGHSTAGNFALKCSPFASLITVDIIVVPALRALTIEQIRSGPVGNIRIVSHRIV